MPSSGTTRASTSASSVLRASKASSSVPCPGASYRRRGAFCMPADCSSTPQTKRADARGCAGITGSANVRLDFWARRSYFKSMNLFLAVLKQRRAIPRESSAVSFAPDLRPLEGASRGGRPCGHLSGHPSRRLAPRPKGRLLAALRRLRAWRLADIPTSREVRCIGSARRSCSFMPLLPLAPFAPGAPAIASALATHRFSGERRWHRLAAACDGPVDGRQRACRGPGGGPLCGPLSGPLCGHPANSAKAGFSRSGRRLRALRFADIYTSPIDRCMGRVRRRPLLRSVRLLAPFALGAIAIASALAPQRSFAEPRGHRPAAAWCGAVGGPLVACLAMARQGQGCPQTRRGRGRARSARVTAVHREEADLDRFVAALLALACEPEGRGERRPGQPRMRTGESSRVEQSCRR